MVFDDRRGILISQSGGDETGHLCRFRAHSPLERDQPANRLLIPSLPSVGAVSDGIAPPPATEPAGGLDAADTGRSGPKLHQRLTGAGKLKSNQLLKA